ncbi:MAG: phosphate transporter [Parcubacteria group bacterium CG23_combo_of_CG06-09_8_20_14_all_35_9]|nr:MAG: phosphate transporter [Parcubacteria group bacterium CG23_combo_of_CG06-09_8_20_14_all_35_9]
MNIDEIKIVLFVAAGLVLFLFGMIKLSDEMKRIFSVRIRKRIKQIVKKPFYGIISGAVITAIFQSSSATTVLVVGMVSAGLMSFYNSLGVVLGADIGTTITAQLVVFKVTTLAPVFLAVGFFIWLGGKGKWKLIGEAVFYFGLLFFGLSLMSQCIAPLKNNPTFIDLFQKTVNPFIGMLISFLFTAVVQSSSVTTGILVILAQQGLITIDNGLPLVLGANIGTTVTAILASIGSNISGKRTALAHFLFKFLGVLICLPFLPFFISFLKFLTPNVAQQVASGHILFNIFMVCIFYFLLKPFAFCIKKILPGEEKVLPLWPEWLDEKYLSSPKLALDAARKELKREIMLAQRMFFDATEVISQFKYSKMRDNFYIEIVVDNLQTEIAEYLVKISKARLKEKEAAKLLCYSAMVDDIERIADQTTNLVKLAKYKMLNKAEFSETAKRELKEIEHLVTKNLKSAISLIEKIDKKEIKNIFLREEEVDEKVKEARERHFERFYKGICPAAVGPIFNDILINLERISDHCENIAEYMGEIQNRH